jgi:hypothetical protein
MFKDLAAVIEDEVKGIADFFVEIKGDKYEAAIFLSTVSAYLVSRIRIDNGGK